MVRWSHNPATIGSHTNGGIFFLPAKTAIDPQQGRLPVGGSESGIISRAGVQSNKNGRRIRGGTHPAQSRREDPAAHLEVDDTGVMIAKTDRGQKCIDIFGLNIREAVLEERKKSIENTKNALALALIGVVQDNQEQVHKFIERVKRIKSGAAGNSAACRIALRSATGKLREIIDLM